MPPGIPVTHLAVRAKAVQIINENRNALAAQGQTLQNLPPATFLDMQNIDLSWVPAAGQISSLI